MKTRIFRVFLLFISVVLFCGCSTTLERQSPLSVRLGDAKLDTTRLVEELLSHKQTAVHAVDGAWRDRTFQAQCVMKGDGESAKIIFLAPQMRLVTITLTKPHSVKCERAAQIPSAFEPEYVLADLAFVNLETSALRRSLGDAFIVDDDGKSRRIKTISNKSISEIERIDSATTHYKNFIHGYEYTLKKIQ